MLMRIILGIGFALGGLTALRLFWETRGTKTCHEIQAFLTILTSTMGVLVMCISPFDFSSTTPYGFSVIGFCWLVIIGNLVNVFQMRRGV